MKKIVSKLVECGFSFEYENKNSSGEKITVWDNGLQIQNYQGHVTFDYEGELEGSDESEAVYDYYCAKIEKIMIQETSSFN